MELDFNISEGDMSVAGTASSTFKKKLLQLGIDPGIIKKAVISLYEAEINMVIHGGGGKVHIDIIPEIATMILIDKGPGIPDIELAMQEGYSTATDRIREMGFGAGMGLPNIKKNSDFMEINTKVGEGTTVTIKVKLA